MDDSYKQKAKEARIKVLQMVHKARTSHIASNFSVIDIATVLYDQLGPDDEVVWSKGWAAATIYYFLAQQGKIPVEDLEKFPNPPYIGLAETTVNGVLCNGGAVGHGTPIATGLALGKMKNQDTGMVFCILSDGELNEGTVWESVAVAAHHKLGNLVFIVDANKWQAMGRTVDVCAIPAKKAFAGFGWNTISVNGHNYEELLDAIHASKRVYERPTMILCHTTKGKGVSFFEDHLLYHYKDVDDETYQRALAELI